MRFSEIYGKLQNKRLNYEQAAEILGVHKRSFRRIALLSLVVYLLHGVAANIRKLKKEHHGMLHLTRQRLFESIAVVKIFIMRP